MAQEYKLVRFEKGDFQDPHGNYWCSAAFEGVSEPVRWVVKDPMTVQIGETYYGELVDATSKTGKPYLRFKRLQKPDDAQVPFNGQAPKKEWHDNSDGQRQGMCFNNAASFINGLADKSITSTPQVWAKSVWTYAKALYDLGDLGSSESTNPKGDLTQGNSTQTTASQTVSTTETSGYDKFKASRPSINTTDEAAHDAEMMSLARSLEQGTPINLDEVPY